MDKHIKWNDKQKETLRKEVKRFNSKIYREKKKNPSLAEFLPETKSVKELMKSITSANELAREVRSMEALFRKGALDPITTTKGIKTTKWELKDLKRRTRIINSRRSKEMEKYSDDPAYQGVLGTIERNNLKPKQFNPDMYTVKGWDRIRDTIHRQAQDSYGSNKQKQYKENYLKAILNEYGEYAIRTGFYEYIKNLPAETLWNGYFESSFLDLQFHYSLHDKFQRIFTIWSEWDKAVEKRREMNYIYDKIERDDKAENNYKYSPYVYENGSYIDRKTGEIIDFEHATTQNYSFDEYDETEEEY